jgi:hypothetical protein
MPIDRSLIQVKAMLEVVPAVVELEWRSPT